MGHRELSSHTPEVTVTRLLLEHAMPVDEALLHVQAHTALPEAQWRNVLDHGGLWFNRARYGHSPTPPVLPSGAQVAVYAFTHAPPLVPLAPEHVLLDREDVVAVNKPCWLPTQGTRASALLSLEARARALLGDPGLVACHRLDVQTSGVVLFARSRTAAAHLAAQFRERRVVKRYLALIGWDDHQPPPPTYFEVRGYLRRVPHPRHSRFAFFAAEPGMWSHTHFEVIQQTGQRALVHAVPHTGRTHQIRVHAASRGYPLCGDTLYGHLDNAASRLLLHAASLTFHLPSGTSLTTTAPTPIELQRAEISTEKLNR